MNITTMRIALFLLKTHNNETYTNSNPTTCYGSTIVVRQNQ